MTKNEIENETRNDTRDEAWDETRSAARSETRSETRDERVPVDLRGRAVLSLRKKQEFRTHLFVYVVVNAALIVMWAVTGAHSFWPIFPMLGWGIGLIFHAQDVYGRREISEEEIRREMEHLR
jgi:hypothetical protein